MEITEIDFDLQPGQNLRKIDDNKLFPVLILGVDVYRPMTSMEEEGTDLNLARRCIGKEGDYFFSSRIYMAVPIIGEYEINYEQVDPDNSEYELFHSLEKLVSILKERGIKGACVPKNIVSKSEVGEVLYDLTALTEKELKLLRKRRRRYLN